MVHFGAQNVTLSKLDGPESSGEVDATLIYADDPKRRLEVVWRDETKHANPQWITAGADSQWMLPGTLQVGESLADA